MFALPREFVLWLSSSVRRFESKHVSSFIARDCLVLFPRTTRDEDHIMILPTPGGASKVPSWESNVFQLLSFGTEDHDAIGAIHCDPEIAICAGRY
jgi:hypothetical protein